MKVRLLLFCLPLLFTGCSWVVLRSPLGMMGAGSYPYVECYTINSDLHTAIRAAVSLKVENPNYEVPQDSSSTGTLADGDLSYWYRMYFYDPEEKTIYMAGLKEEDKPNTSTFALILVCPYDHEQNRFGEMERINMDFRLKRNMHYLKRFKKLFVETIREKAVDSGRPLQ
ncbi:MAG: hypothetical protein FD123_3119 [Bacteroidetes bacterium]|nr:MAG: hypothetical protein FD123_3119 [Bacteroidota bacterium]